MKVISAVFHLTLLFGIVWFFLGQILIYRHVSNSERRNLCEHSVIPKTILIIIFEYIVILWYYISYIWDSVVVWQWLWTIVKDRLKRINSHNGKSDDFLRILYLMFEVQYLCIVPTLQMNMLNENETDNSEINNCNELDETSVV